MIKGQKCEDCIHFYLDQKKTDRGQCRCNPPQIVVISKVVESYHQSRPLDIIQRNMLTPQVIFPPMLASDPGCGRYKSNYVDKGNYKS